MKTEIKKHIQIFIGLFIATLLFTCFIPSRNLGTVQAAGTKLNKKQQILLKGEKFTLSLKGHQKNLNSLPLILTLQPSRREGL